MSFLPDFKLETYFSRWEFNTKYILCASDTESLSLKYLLELADDEDKKLLEEIKFGYTETYGSLSLRTAISSTYNNATPNDIITFAGAEEGIFIAMKSILTSNDHAIVVTPSYQSAQTIPASICEVTPISLDPNNNWNLDIGKIKDSIKSNTRLISINFPHNPTGKVISQDELKDIVGIAKEKDIYIFSDEIYRLMERDEEKRLDQISDIYDKGLSLSGMSKAYGMPGIRIGWISCKDHLLLDKMEKLKHYLSICNSSPNEILTVISLKYKSEIINRTRKIIKNNLKELNNFFQDFEDLFDWKEPDGGCIGFPKYKGPKGSDIFCEKLIKEKSVLLLPSSVYNSELMSAPSNHFRIGYGRLNMPQALSKLRDFIVNN